MPTILKTKNSVTTTVVPTTLQQGELAVNITDKKMWVGNAATTPVQLIGDGGSGNFTTVDTTNLQVTNIKAKDGTASASIANSTGIFTHATATVFTAGTVSLPAITTTGDTNTGIYFPAADTIAFTEGGVESMRIDSAGLVGIGTSSPSSYNSFADNLVIAGTDTGLTIASGTSNYGSIHFADGTSGSDAFRGQIVYFHTNNYMSFSTDAAERMRIGSTGNIGIGVSSASSRLDISAPFSVDNSGASNKWSARLFDSSSMAAGVGGSILFQGDKGTGAGNFAGIAGLKENATSGNEQGYLSMYTVPSSGTITERMRITSAGNVGIGTASPSVKLHVSGARAIIDDGTGTQIGLSVGTSSTSTGTNYGAIDVNGTAYSGLFLRVGNTSNGYFQASAGTSVVIGSVTNIPFVLATNETERMRIDSSGNLLVGTTARMSSEKVIIQAASVSTGLAIRMNNSSGTYNAVEFYDGDSTLSGTIAVNNSANTTAYNTSSDYRLKENIAPMTGALNKIQALKPVTYIWKNTPNLAGQGFIAHELQEVVPDCVTGEKDAVDTEGNPVYQGIDTSFLVATLTAAIQEQQALIENLTTRLNALEGK
jgi:hypothetical protein